MSNLSEFLKSKNAEERSRFLIGKEVTIVGNISAHNYGKLGAKFTVDQCIGDNGNSASLKKIGSNNYFIGYTDIEVSMNIEMLNAVKADNAKSIENLNKDNEDIDKKIEFINQYGLEEYDENIFKVSSVLATLEQEMTNIEKAKLIAKLIKN